jgi:hypothetical protein
MAIKIRELTSATTIQGTEELPIVQSSTTKKVTADNLLGYKVFAANLTWDTLNEEFNNDVFKDTITGLSFNRTGAGLYEIESAGSLFATNKTYIMINQNNYSGAGGPIGNFTYNYAWRNSTAIIKISTADVDVEGANIAYDDLLANLSIEIRVYP